VEQLADFIRSQNHRWGDPPFLVGHSLGGFLSVMVAAKYPELARGVLMLDSPLIAGWRATTLGVAKHTTLVGAVSPGKVSQRRRNRWPNMQEAQAYFQSRALFSQWHPQVLRDYLQHGLEADTDGQLHLRFTREVETAIYNTLPHNLSSWLSRHPLRCPVAFIGGRMSVEIK
ncbi:MAG: alpha/beta fold hydrolase, partial [Comamonas sp.]